MITLNNPDHDDRSTWARLLDRGDPAIQFFVFQTELGTTGTVHYQCYVEFKRPTRLRGVKGLFGTRTHCERRRGSQAQAVAYCTKDDTRSAGAHGQFGTPKKAAGHPKGEFGKCIGAIVDGATLESVRDDFPATMAMFGDRVVQYSLGLMGERDWAMVIDIFVGPSGSGKSSTAKSENPGCYHAPWPTGGRWWWPGYEGQEVVVLDEFRHDIKCQVMLRLLDRHTMTLEAKGSNFQFVSKKIVITTNLDPCEWYMGVPRHARLPLQRRLREFARIWDFGPGGTYPNFVKVLRYLGTACQSSEVPRDAAFDLRFPDMTTAGLYGD